MNLRNFPVLTDENIDSGLVDFLRKTGFEVYSIIEEGKFGLSDLEILQQSFSKGQVILTQDSDFGTLIFRDQVEFVGIIYLRPGHFSSDFHIATFKTILSGDFDLMPPFILVAENTGHTVKIRVRSFG